MRYTTGYGPFVHYTCTWQNYKDKLWQAVLNGYLSPRAFGLLQETSVSWNRTRPIHLLNKICDYKPQEAYFNILPANPLSSKSTYTSNPGIIPQVEANRKKYSIQKFSVDLALKKLEKEKGFKFFFGFMDAT